MNRDTTVLSRAVAVSLYRGKGDPVKLATDWVDSIRCVKLAKDEKQLLEYSNQAVNSAIRNLEQAGKNLAAVLKWRERLEKTLPVHQKHAKSYSGQPLVVWLKFERERLILEIKHELESYHDNSDGRSNSRNSGIYPIAENRTRKSTSEVSSTQLPS